MRILQINKFFYRRGGVEVVFFDTIKGLRERGHEVSEFSMISPGNLASDYSAYFASAIPELVGKNNLAAQWKIFKRLFYSAEIEKKLKALILANEPHVAHLHGVYHHLSASTFTELYNMKIPMVLTLHDFFPLSPSRNFLHGETLDESIYKNKFYNCIRYRCINNKLIPSVAGTLEAYYYRLKKIWQRIDLYVCPSQFMADKFVEYGFPAEKMRVVPNPLKSQEVVPPLGNKIVYLGRIHYEKGIKTLMEAAKELRDYKMMVVGSGPEDAWVQEFARKNILSNIERISWVGGESWQQVMREAKVIVVPSLFYENCSMGILEALSYGRIVVAVDRGGNPELIKDGINGFLCKPEDPTDLARVIRRAMDTTDEEAAVISGSAIKTLNQNHNPEDYFKKLEAIYAEVV
ncbi:MAG: Glycosyltransferase [Parcubacteria group bacterium Gr01-1014_13]|nr:MAG: Glycosyltransferase [Parcubacteria group bacterium Gr01-1014_13]